MTREELRDQLLFVAKNDYKHMHYDRVVNYADWCHKIITGKSHDELIVSYKTRETDGQKKQRISIYNSATKYAAGRVIQTFSKVERSDNIVDNIKYPDKTDEGAENVKQIMQALGPGFHGNDDMPRYLFDTLRRLNFYDPNSFLVVEFINDDPINKKPTVYPLEVYSTQAVDYKYTRGKLDYLVSCWPIKIQVDGAEKDGKRYTIYGPQYSYVLESASMANDMPVITPDRGELVMLERNSVKTYWYLTEYHHKIPHCPARCVGYMEDMETNGQTFVSPLDPASEIFTDLINRKSEYDLSMALHGFLQKIVMAPACEHQTEEEGTCLNGKMSFSQSECQSCHGTGLMIHKTVQDIQYIRRPADKEEHIPLREMVHYVEVPTHIIDHQRKELDDAVRRVSMAIFNTAILDRNQVAVAVTATEKMLDYDSAYDVFSQYGRNYSGMWEFVVTTTAEILQIGNGLEATHAFPSNFHMETLAELLAIRKAAIDSGAPYHILQRIDEAIMIKQNQDDNDNMLFNQAREKFRPWREKSKEERMYLLGILPADDRNVVLYTHFEEIFTEIRNSEAFSKGNKFYELTWKRQKEVLDSMLLPYIEAASDRIQSSRQIALPVEDEQ